MLRLIAGYLLVSRLCFAVSYSILEADAAAANLGKNPVRNCNNAASRSPITMLV